MLMAFAVLVSPAARSDPLDPEGPGTSIKLSIVVPDIAEIDFSRSGLAVGASTYFSLEGP
jgi:hypothetical protein